MSDETTLEDARGRLRRLGVQVPVLAAAAAVAFGGVSTVAPGTATAAPPSASSGEDDHRAFRQKAEELRKLAQKGSISAGVHLNRLLEEVAKRFPGCVGKCLGQKIAESGIPNFKSVDGVLTFGKQLYECIADCYHKGKIKSSDQAQNEYRQRKAEEKRAARALKKARERGEDTAELDRKHEEAKQRTATASKEVTRAHDREKHEQRLGKALEQQDADRQAAKEEKAAKKQAKKDKKAQNKAQRKAKRDNGDEGDGSARPVRPTRPPSSGPSSTGKTAEPSNKPTAKNNKAATGRPATGTGTPGRSAGVRASGKADALGELGVQAFGPMLEKYAPEARKQLTKNFNKIEQRVLDDIKRQLADPVQRKVYLENYVKYYRNKPADKREGYDLFGEDSKDFVAERTRLDEAALAEDERKRKLNELADHERNEVRDQKVKRNREHPVQPPKKTTAAESKKDRKAKKDTTPGAGVTPKKKPQKAAAPKTKEQTGKAKAQTGKTKVQTGKAKAQTGKKKATVPYRASLD